MWNETTRCGAWGAVIHRVARGEDIRGVGGGGWSPQRSGPPHQAHEASAGPARHGVRVGGRIQEPRSGVVFPPKPPAAVSAFEAPD